jgi:uncharacterized short protein YbdD (DUF466 family)
MKWLKTIINYLNEIAGVPNYQRYLIHFQKCHPEATPLSEKEFHRKATDEKYGSGNIRRCC